MNEDNFKKWLFNFPQLVKIEERKLIFSLLDNVKKITGQSKEDILIAVDFNDKDKTTQKLESILTELRTVVFLKDFCFTEIKILKSKKKTPCPDISAKFHYKKFVIEVKCLTKFHSREKDIYNVYSIKNNKFIKTLLSIFEKAEKQFKQFQNSNKLLVFVLNRSPELELYTKEDLENILNNLFDKLKDKNLKGMYFGVCTGSEVNGELCNLISPKIF